MITKIDTVFVLHWCNCFFVNKSYFWDCCCKNVPFQAKASGKTPEECRNMGDEIGVSCYHLFQISFLLIIFLLFLDVDMNQASILGNYSNILRTCNALDYHDLISCSVKLLSDFPKGLNYLYICNQFMQNCNFLVC